MKELINVYSSNRKSIETFLLSLLKTDNICNLDQRSIQNNFDLLPFLMSAYIVNQDFMQTSPKYMKNEIMTSFVGQDRSHFFRKVIFNDEGTYVSNVYIGNSNSKPRITVAQKIEDDYFVMDFDLAKLLNYLRLIDDNSAFRTFSKILYAIIGFSMVGVVLFLIFYSASTFFNIEEYNLHTTFKPIISITLALALFDLAKNILHQEVFYKSSLLEGTSEDKNLLIRFLISITIALSIESLMVVFKIALSDYNDMINAVYLILGTCMLILSIGVFSYLNHKSKS
jgi:hypothetical protein